MTPCARSEAEGLTPVYYVGEAVFRTGEGVPYARWDANGYRLPTEAEWEKAARGGLVGHHFPWPSLGGIFTDHVSGDKANYGASGDPFEGTNLATTPIDYYEPNGYGLYDMAGNVWEWCWDWYQSDWYSQAGATESNTHGPSSGSVRVLRGGSWNAGPGLLLCAGRDAWPPDSSYNNKGFRCARGL